MKQIGIILTVILFAACNQSKPSVSNKRDTGVIGYAPKDSFHAKDWRYIDAVYGQAKKYAYDDSTSEDYKIDTTIYFVYQAVDTVRNPATKKAIYDSVNKRYNFKLDWVAVDKKALSGMKFKIIEKTSK